MITEVLEILIEKARKEKRLKLNPTLCKNSVEVLKENFSNKKSEILEKK